jgi:hypothetical protein
MVTGLGILAVLLGLMGLLQNMGWGMGIAVLLGIAFSPVSNGTIPFAFSVMPPDRGGLGVGMFFGGSALAGMLLNLAISQFGAVSLMPAVVGGTLAFLMAGLLIYYSSCWKAASKECE